MDRDRIEGAAKTIGGNIKEVVGKVVGDQKTVADGKAEQKVGKLQNSIGGIKDSLRNVRKNG